MNDSEPSLEILSTTVVGLVTVMSCRLFGWAFTSTKTYTAKMSGPKSSGNKAVTNCVTAKNESPRRPST